MTEVSPVQGLAILIATRTTSVLSVCGSTIIVTTFVFFPFFRKPINRLVFFATFGNILANVATLMSTSVIPKKGHPPSGLCEFQAMLIQWFMMADAFWVFCMAMNVLLVFFYGYDAQQLRHLEKWYLLFGYGLPGIPAITYVILDHNGFSIMGPATLWCWVAPHVDWMRIALFYAPVWVVICATMTIYSLTGYRIYKRRAELRSISGHSHEPSMMRSSCAVRDDNTNPFAPDNSIVVTTQIKFDVQDQNSISRCVSQELENGSISSFSSTRGLSKDHKTNELNSAPSSTPTVSRAPKIRLDDPEAQRDTPRQCNGTARNGYRATVIANNIPTDSTVVPVALPSTRTTGAATRRRTAEGHAAAMAYSQVAFLMFLALFVTWMPSSINRMYQFVNKLNPSYTLNLLSAIVLPLQGAWNAIIYISTTRTESKHAWRMTKAKFTGTSEQGPHHRKDVTRTWRETKTLDVALDEMDDQTGCKGTAF